MEADRFEVTACIPSREEQAHPLVDIQDELNHREWSIAANVGHSFDVITELQQAGFVAATGDQQPSAH
jgi:hypothetical protein